MEESKDWKVWVSNTEGTTLVGEYKTGTFTIYCSVEQEIMTMESRIPKYLAGEKQIKWKLEDGSLDHDLITKLRPERKYSSGIRFFITGNTINGPVKLSSLASDYFNISGEEKVLDSTTIVGYAEEYDIIQ